MGNANAGRPLKTRADLALRGWHTIKKKFLTRNAIASTGFLLLVIILVGGVIISGTTKPKDVTLITHNSFVMSKALVADFDKTTGYKLKLVQAGDVGALTNRLILSKTTPFADVVFGIDNTFSTWANQNNIIDGAFVPTDFGDVCFNYDKIWFATHKIPVPTSINQLTQSQYKGLSVVENPNLDSTGLSFLAATVGKYGTSWTNYWRALKANGVKVDNGWQGAYYTDFSGSSGKGPFPIVLSYATSPADEIRSNGESQTSSILDGCFAQTEYVGVLKNAKNPAGAKAVIKYLLSSKFQQAFPSTMYMFPIVRNTPVPSSWRKFAQIAPITYGDHLDFSASRKKWLVKWNAIFD